MDLGETVSARQSHSSVSLILASLFIFVFVTLLLSLIPDPGAEGASV